MLANPQNAAKVDLAHHLSLETRTRLPNPMKSIWRMAQKKPDAVNMANGNPHPGLYPISEINFKVPSVTENEDPVSTWRAGTSPTQIFASYKDEPCALSLQVALQYGTGDGLLEVRNAIKRLNTFLHSPSDDHVVTLSLGNADAIAKCFRLLGDPGDSFLVEEFSFPGMTNAPLAHQIRWVPVKLDNGGMIPEDMERILQDWDESKQGKRPHVLYIIPCGQNPTGSTLSLQRRQKIYDIASRWDLIIVEDDPYYFLQYDHPPFDPEAIEKDGFARTFARHLAPSFLSLDTEGRVMRIDSFSKIIAPGMRLGWITSNSLFATKLELLTDSSTQHPHGLGQAFIAEMLGDNGWQIDGFMRWVKSLCNEYQRRRDLLIHLFRTEMGDCELASADVPEAGMFLWIRINVQRHPRYSTKGSNDASGRSNAHALMDELFQRTYEAGVIMIHASIFAVLDASGYSDPADHIHERCNYFRATFAGVDETMEQGMAIFGRAVKEFFQS